MAYWPHARRRHRGWPIGHTRAEADARNHLWQLYADLYAKTLNQHRLYKEAGYRVFCVWGLDFAKTCQRCPMHILDAVREV